MNLTYRKVITGMILKSLCGKTALAGRGKDVSVRWRFSIDYRWDWLAG